MYKISKITARFFQFYNLDLRALSLLRIGIAIVILADLLIRGGDLSAHYTDDGVWPTSYVRNHSWLKGYWTIHDLSGEYWYALLLFCIHFCLALFLLTGLKTRWVTLLIWLMYISLHNRNIFINQAGDDVLRLVLFWGMFLPWNAHYSLDASKEIIRYKRPLAQFGYLMLLASVYFFTATLKYGKEWTIDATAIYYALSLEQLRIPVTGEWLYQHPQLMKVLTVTVLAIEWIVPLLILFPSRKGHLRGLAFALLLCLHAGIGLTLYVGLFYIINIVSALGLLPSSVMDKTDRWLQKFRNTKVVLRRTIKPGRRGVFATNMICLTAIIVGIAINLGGVKWFRYELRSESLIPVHAVRMDQYWGMFSPNILKKDGWYVYYGLDSIGRQWDLARNEDYVSFEKPESIISIHRTDRWRKLTENMQGESFTFLRPLFCKYNLRKWNRKHPEKKMYSLYLYYMQKETLPDYQTTPVRKRLFSVCYDY